MTDIAELKGLTSEEIERLKTAEIKTIDDLWKCFTEIIENDGDEPFRNTQIKRSRLIELLALEGMHNARESQQSKRTIDSQVQIFRKEMRVAEALWAQVEDGAENKAEQTNQIKQERLFGLLAARGEYKADIPKEDTARLVGTPFEDITKLPGNTDQLAGKLRKKNIQTIDELWRQVGTNDETGIEQVAAETEIKPAILTALLVNQAMREAKQQDGSRSERFWRRVRKNWLELILSIGLIFLLMLGLRIAGVLGSASAPIGLKNSVLIAAHNLESGHILQPTDVYEALLPGTNYITSAEDLAGSIVAQNVARGKPLRFGDITRLQVVAASDILSGTIIETSAISMSWSTYQPDAAVYADQVASQRARHAIRKGTVISTNFITATVPVSQVVIVAPAGLPAFHIISTNDVTVENQLERSGTFTTISDVVGHYTLQSIPSGRILRANQISLVKLPESDWGNRRIISLPMDRETLGPGVAPGSHVSILLSPRDPSTRNSGSVELNDAIILVVAQDKEATSIVIAITETDFTRAQPLLGTSDAFAFQKTP